MLPVRCSACGRFGLPRDPRIDTGRPVAHVRDDLPGQPCLNVQRLPFGDAKRTIEEWQLIYLDRIELDA